MALQRLGTTSNSILYAVQWSQSLSDADIAAISGAITDDKRIGAILGGGSPGPSGILCTGTLATDATLADLVDVSGGSILTMKPGDVVLGAGVAPGTFIATFDGTDAATLSQATTASGSGVKLAIVPPNKPALSRTGHLYVPRRGVLSLQDGDVIAVDNTGAVILVPGAAISYSGSQWVLT